MNDNLHIQALTQYGIEKDIFLWDYDEINKYKYCTSLSNGFNRIYYIIKGNAEFKTDNQTKQIGQGKLYIFPANTNYTLIQRIFAPFEHIYFHVQLFTPINTFMSFDIDKNSYEYSLLMFMKECIDNTEPKYAIQLFELLLSKVFQQDNNKSSYNQIYIAKKFLDENLTTEKINIETVSKLISLDCKYFIKRFKKIYDKSPMQYYNDEKLKYAYSDLLDGISPSEIADKYNYSSLSNFSLKFKKKFGFPPSKCIKYSTCHKFLK